MPHVDDPLHAGPEAPKEPHLGLLIKEGQTVAIPPGATMFIIMDPSRAEMITPLVLARVSPKELTFHCACGDPKCNRIGRFRAVWTGWHNRSAGRIGRSG